MLISGQTLSRYRAEDRAPDRRRRGRLCSPIPSSSQDRFVAQRVAAQRRAQASPLKPRVRRELVDDPGHDATIRLRRDAVQPVRACARGRARSWRHHIAALSLERWSHHFHLVLFHERSVRFRIHTLPFLEHLLKPPWRHAHQQHARLRPDVLEGVRGASRDEHNGLSGRAHGAVTELDLKLPAHDVEELVLRLVDVRGRPALGRDGLPNQAERSSGLVSCCHQFRDIRFSALRPGESRCTAWQNDKPRFCSGRG